MDGLRNNDEIAGVRFCNGADGDGGKAGPGFESNCCFKAGYDWFLLELWCRLDIAASPIFQNLEVV